ncbi:hypothetical protein JTE90_006792 [Oedothorax gibbosus]|uniref:Zinc finger protein 865 n=1 Tax=Oedothorax gibbosus TaxID=931172 RepID=A0AAV6VNC6_9ARAC|nr:hypothetical protein JTE90_006792 [Oedothorax gibbosus]
MSESTQFESQSATDTENEPTNNFELEKPFVCHFCSQRFGTQDNLTLHLQIHSIEKSFPCKICNKTFQTKVRLENHHKKQHVAKDINKTQVVTVPSPTRSIMSKLIPTKITKTSGHTSRLSYSRVSYPCDECGKTFASRAMLTVHMRIHTKEQPFESHERSHHFTEKPYECALCHKTFATQLYFKKHMEMHGSDPIKSASIDKSPSLVQIPSLSLAMPSASRAKSYKCTVCNETFNRKRDLSSHYRVHGDVTDKLNLVSGQQSTSLVYGTPKVDKYGSRISEIAKDILAIKASLLRVDSQTSDAGKVSNRNLASKDSAMDCSEDSEADSLASENQQESEESSDVADTAKMDQKPGLATFTGEKLFKCDLCPKDFTTKQDLVEHSKIHKGDKPFQCEQCPNRFSQKNSLEFHCKSVHGGRNLNVALEKIQQKLLNDPSASYKPLKQKLVLRKQATHSWEVYNADEDSSDD